MKRIIISIIIFALCASGAAVEVFCVSRSVDNYLESIEKIDDLVSDRNFADASENCAELESKWNDTLRSVDIVLIHDYVDKIGISISQMRAYAENNSADSYFAASAEAKRALESIKDSEFPFVENIL